MKKYSAYILFACIAAFSCSKRSDIPVYDLSAAFHSQERFNRDDYFSDISYVALDTAGENSLLGDIARFHLYGDTIIFVDRRDRLSAFDAGSGNYLHQIGMQGRGPEEYSGTYQTLFLKDRIYVDGWINEFRVFDTRGHFLRTLVMPGMKNGRLFELIPERKQMSENSFAAYYFNRTGGEERLLEVFDADGNVTASIPNHNLFERENSLNIGGFAQFHDFENKVYFFEQPNDTVFCIDNGGLVPALLLERSGSQKNTYENPSDNPDAIELYDFHEYDRYLTMFAYVGDDDFYFICDKATGEVRCFPLSSMDPFEKAVFYNSLLDQQSDELITFIYPHEYLDAKEAGVLPEKLRSLPVNITENSNPILLKIKLRSE